MRVLVDHRYYRVKPGTMNAHLDLYEKHGFLPQTRSISSDRRMIGSRRSRSLS